jgi:precorrin-2 dehydrogenase/sirohydrochlorin ferrochelatase
VLPLFVDMTDKRVAVFGAGPVGVRKANFFAREAEVAAVSLSFAEGLDPKVRAVTADIRTALHQWVEWADVVVAATDDRVLNDEIVAAARARGRPVNRADGVCTFLIPSVVEREGYVVAISTLGRSPGLSRYLRIRLDELLGPRYDRMLRLQEELREAAKERIPSSAERERYLRAVLDDDRTWTLLEQSEERARERALERLEGWDEHHP